MEQITLEIRRGGAGVAPARLGVVWPCVVGQGRGSSY